MEITVAYEYIGYTFVIWALGTVTKGLVQELEDLKIRGRVETVQNDSNI